MARTEIGTGTANLQAERPGWRVWRARRGDELGSWMATRRGDLTDAQSLAGCDPTLMADDERGLRVLLEEQDRCEEKASAL